MSKSDMYAVVQLGHAVFAIGATKDEAIRNADSEFGEDWRTVSLRDAVDGDIVIVPCTEKFAATYREQGGAFSFDITDGTAHLPDNDWFEL